MVYRIVELDEELREEFPEGYLAGEEVTPEPLNLQLRRSVF